VRQYESAIFEPARRRRGEYWTNSLMLQVITASQLSAYFTEGGKELHGDGVGATNFMELLWSRH
jgi:hypothetical protein